MGHTGVSLLSEGHRPGSRAAGRTVHPSHDRSKRHTKERLRRADAGITPADIDVLYIQEPTAVWVLEMLEYHGFRKVDAGGTFLAEDHTYPGGSLPLNTMAVERDGSRGQLSKPGAPLRARLAATPPEVRRRLICSNSSGAT